MGRRKIEIQPITHERNRSVTFLKRKNGLFKKAYELGVLCSVDVAVIIFEERPGHHVKLFQYCSTDVNSMVNRHIRFDGERDTRGPADFSGNTKNDNAEDDDEDGEDDDGTRPSKGRQATNKTAKVKTETTNGSLNINGAIPIRPVPQANTDLSMIDLDYRLSPTGGSSSMTIPISGERLSAASPPVRNISHSLSSKRPRLDDGSHLPAHANAMPALPQSLNLSSLAASAGSSNSNMPHYPYRLEVDMSSGYPVQTGVTPLPTAPGLPPTHSASHPSLQYGNPGLNMGMNGSGGMLGSQSAPAGFLPQLGQGAFGMDIGSGHHAPSMRTVGYPSSQHSQAGSASPYTPQHTPAPMYQQQRQTGVSTATAMALELLGQAAGGGDMGGGGQGGMSSFDWPVHGGGQQGHQENAGSSQSGTDSNSNWFDFLSGTSSGAQPNPLSAASLFPSTAPSARPVGISSAARSVGNFAMPASVSVASSPGTGQKRPREDDTASIHSMHSVHSMQSSGRERSEERASVGRRSVSVDKPPS
ncbi:uncharacterized protein C8Q71DRAFT_905173 [Rhodofomes roseus]|uniref:MADS-box domain-containing protein n=1 Tax=Rhodofomes roseus TaxID=34475 RepID=A0ABQ8KNM3_9APHY|nr:uncharacterized protein C8Q71DRAFT_905173 [Rhodofomes roseus]KAH9839758.1 hypothetical protein C8Q71DRAFT_905173 [Rhodofomes roseus]